MSDCVSRLGEEVGELFQQASPCAGISAGMAGARDSGYDSLHRRLSVLERLVHTHAVWLQLGLSHQDAARILHSQPAGVRQRQPQYSDLSWSKISNSQPCKKSFHFEPNKIIYNNCNYIDIYVTSPIGSQSYPQ